MSAAPNDKQQLGPTLQSIPASVGVPADLLVDTGFYSAAAIAQVERRADGTLSGITVYAAVEKSSHHRTVADLEVRPEPETPGPDASAKDQMRHRLCTSGGQAKYRLRKQTVEPVLGVIKEVLGFRRFLLRGLAKVALEWELVSLAWNLKRLLKLGLMEKLAARP